MATLAQLIPYLKQGYTLQCANGETLTPSVSVVDRRLIVTWLKPETRERYFQPVEYTLSEVKAMHPIWDYGVIFLSQDEHKREYVITRLEGIEQAVAANRPHTRYGIEPK